MPDARLRETLPRARELALLCAARGLACAAAWASGFRALSDDDYARLAIAQRFAASARLDPSGTSWLPAPFWVYGSAFRCFGASLGVARATAIVLSTAATVLVYVAARWLGACRPGALASAALCSALPYSALLGIAALPEVPCGALTLLGAAALARTEPTARVFGALSLSAACLSRYEAWPVAAVFAGFSLCDALRSRGSGSIRQGSAMAWASCAALALSGPALWLVLGALEHGHALFFVARVTAYRRALGGGGEGALWQRLIEYPGLLVRAEPELLLLLLAVGASAKGVTARGKLAAYRRASIALFASLAFLILGSARDGAPTHHAARVLLPIWFFACVLCGHGLAHLTARGSGAARLRLYATSGLAVFFGLLLRPKLLPAEGFAERQLEIDAGREARREGVDALTIDTSDYGYFAVEAGFGSPARSSVLDDHDPRQQHRSAPFADSAALTLALSELNAHFLIATQEHAPVARGACDELWQNPKFVLFRCPARALVAPGGP